MADHEIAVCNNWNGSQGDKVTFTNNTGANCNITQIGSTWPFKDGPSLYVPNGGTCVTHLKNPLHDGAYTYDVDCCANAIPKTVTVP